MLILIPSAVITLSIESMRTPLKAFSILLRVTTDTSQSIAAVLVSNPCWVRLALITLPAIDICLSLFTSYS